jgi:hypothetical protein
LALVTDIMKLHVIKASGSKATAENGHEEFSVQVFNPSRGVQPSTKQAQYTNRVRASLGVEPR